MKKLLIIALVTLFLLSGCKKGSEGGGGLSLGGGGNSFTCTNTDSDGSKSSITASFQNDKMSMVVAITEMPTEPDFADFQFSLMKGIVEGLFNEIDGMDMSVDINADKTVITMKMTIDYAKLDFEALAALGGEFGGDTTDITKSFNETLTAAQYKKQLEDEGYTCK